MGQFTSLGGPFTAPPAVVVYVLGTDSAVWRRRWLGDSWTDWHSLGHTFLSSPAAVTRIPSFPTRDLAGLGTDNAVWHLQEEDT